MVIRTVLLTLSFALCLAHADEAEVRPVFGAHPGYLFNVEDEKNKRDLEMVMLEPPPQPPPPKSKPLVDQKLSKEFQDQYRLLFGETYIEQEINNPARDDGYYYYNSQSVTIQAYATYQRQFGNYMMRRIAEYNFDNWFKSDPQLKPIYDLKDRVSNLDVKVKPGWKIKWKYSLSGPSMEANVENPYKVETQVKAMMSGIISKPVDMIYTVADQLTPKWRVTTLHKSAEELWQVVIARSINRHVTISLTASTGQLPGNPLIYQNLALVGLGYAE